MAFTYAQSERDLNLRGRIVLTTGAVVELSPTNVMSYSIDEQSSSNGYALGETESASYELIIDDIEHGLTPTLANGAVVTVEIAIHDGVDYAWSPFGKWTVDTCVLSKQNVTATLRGYDALGVSFEAAFGDKKGNYPRTLLQIAQAVSNEAGVTLETTDFLNASTRVSSLPKWPEGITLRGVIGSIAACAGGFARINRSGGLEIVPYTSSESVGVIDPNIYKKIEANGGDEFDFNCLAVRYVGKDDFTRFAIDADLPDDASNTLQVDDNALFTAAIANTVKAALTGLKSAGMSVEWVGDPDLKIGDVVTLREVDGADINVLINQQNIKFVGGMTATSSANIPTETGSASSYTLGESALTAAGMLNGRKLIVESVKTDSLAAQSITTEKIAAGAVTADTIAADTITSDKLNAQSVAAYIVEATTAKFAEIAADKLTADALYAAVADVVTLMVEQITANNIDTNELYAELARVIELRVAQINADTINTDTLYANLAEIIALRAEQAAIADLEADRMTAAIATIADGRFQSVDIDFARVKDLTTDTAIITEGVAGELYINRLAITEGNVVSLSVGQLMVRGADGAFYQLGVDEDGEFTASRVSVDGGNIAEGSVSAGKIIDSSITAQKLDVRNVFADSAIVRELIAANLDVAALFAREATIAELNAVDISGNQSLRLYVRQSDLETYLRLTQGQVELGESESPVKVQLRTGDNAGLYITENGQANAYFGENKARVERLEMGEAIIIGKTAIVAQNNGDDVFWLGR